MFCVPFYASHPAVLIKKKIVSLEDQEEDGDHGQQEDHPGADGCRGFL